MFWIGITPYGLSDRCVGAYYPAEAIGTKLCWLELESGGNGFRLPGRFILDLFGYGVPLWEAAALPIGAFKYGYTPAGLPIGF